MTCMNRINLFPTKPVNRRNQNRRTLLFAYRDYLRALNDLLRQQEIELNIYDPITPSEHDLHT